MNPINRCVTQKQLNLYFTINYFQLELIFKTLCFPDKTVTMFKSWFYRVIPG